MPGAVLPFFISQIVTVDLMLSGLGIIHFDSELLNWSLLCLVGGIVTGLQIASAIK